MSTKHQRRTMVMEFSKIFEQLLNKVKSKPVVFGLVPGQLLKPADSFLGPAYCGLHSWRRRRHTNLE